MTRNILPIALVAVAACTAANPASDPAAAPAPASVAAEPAAPAASQAAPPAAAAASAPAPADASDPDRIASGGITVSGWTGRLDPRPVAQGRTIADTRFSSMGDGFHVTSGPAAIYWNPANTARGNYTVSASFTQTKPSAHPEGYGLFLAGTNLTAPNQGYLYFLVRQDGRFLINHRASDTEVHKILDWTAHPAVRAIPATGGSSTNALSVVVAADKLSFRVNGTEVHNIPRSTIDAGGPHSGTAGIAGIRINHNLDVHVSGFSVTPTA